MTIKVESVMKKDLVTLLSDVDIEYVSHVPNGANRIPYKILKSDATAPDVAKEIVDVLKSFVDDQLSASSTAASPLQGHHSDLPGSGAQQLDKLNKSQADQHAAFLKLRDQLKNISPSDLNDISNDHLEELKSALQKLQDAHKELASTTVKFEDDQPRDNSGRWTTQAGAASTPRTVDRLHEKVNRAVQEVHDHAIVIGEIAPKIASMASVAATALTVVAPLIPHPAVKAAVIIAAKAAAGIAAAAEITAVTSHEVERDMKNHINKAPHGNPQLEPAPAKSDTGEGDMSLEVIHSIIQPVGKDIRALEEIYPEWFKNVKLTEKLESEEKTVFLQKSDEAFDESAFRFLDAGYGLEFKVGKLKRTEKSDDALLIPTQISPTKDDITAPVDPSLTPDTAANLNPDPMDTPIVEQPADEQPAPAYPIAPDMSLPPTTETYTFGDMFQSKLNAFASAVVAAMELSEDPVTRRKVIQTFWKSFGNFLNAALDRVDANTAKSDATEPTTITKDETDTEQNDTGGFDMSELFATKDEMKTFIIDTVKTALKEEKDSASATPAEPQPVEKSDVDQLAEITQKLEGLTETIKGFDTIKAELSTIKEKTESLAHGTGPRRSWSEDVQSTTVTQKGEAHVMTGVFTNL